MSRATDTKAQVFDLVRAAGRTSQADLVAATGLTGATISIITRQLLEEGLVEEAGRSRSTGGKPRTLVSVVPDARHAVGVHLRRSDMVLVLTDLMCGVVARTRRPVPAEGSLATMVDVVRAGVAEIVEGAGADGTDVAGIGLAVSGHISSGARQTPWGQDVNDLRLALAEEGGAGVHVDDAATAAALGEWWVSPHGQADDSLVVYIGSGFGSGIVRGGRLERGSSLSAGALGHVCVDLHGPVCTCGARGCVEAVAGPGAIVEQAWGSDELGRLMRETAALRGDLDTEAQFAVLAGAARLGDRAAADLLEASAQALAAAVRSVLNVVDVPAVVLTGPGAGVAGAVYLTALEREVLWATSAHAGGPVRVRLSQNCGTAAALGAAATVLDAMMRPRA